MREPLSPHRDTVWVGAGVARRRNAAVRSLAYLSPIAGLFLMACLAKTLGAAVFPFGLVVAVGLVGLGQLVWHRDPAPERTAVTVRAVASTLYVGEESYRRSELREGWAYRRDDGRIEARFVSSRAHGFEPDVVVELESEAEARALLRVLRFDASQSVARFRTGSELRRRLRSRGFAAAFLGLVGAAVAVSLAFPVVRIVALAATMLAYLVPSTTRVGADGVLFRWLWVQRFVPASDIARASHYVQSAGRSREVGVELHLRDGSVERIPVGGSSFNDDRALALAHRIRHVAEGGARPVDAHVTEQLARRDEDVSTWVGRLRALGSGANASHRVAPTSRDALLEVVEDAGAAPGIRVAAAVALGPELPPDQRVRVAAAAESVAAPRLRVALERVTAASDDAELAACLERLEV